MLADCVILDVHPPLQAGYHRHPLHLQGSSTLTFLLNGIAEMLNRNRQQHFMLAYIGQLASKVTLLPLTEE